MIDNDELDEVSEGKNVMAIGLMEIALMCGYNLSDKGKEFANQVYNQANKENKHWIDEQCTEVKRRF
jgi:hypothetical protein